MTDEEFDQLVHGLRVQASIWFKDATLLELEELIKEAYRGRRRGNDEEKQTDSC